MSRFPFYNALTHLNDFYGINMTEDQFENIGIHAWDHIGNKEVRTYRYCAKVEDSKIDLPCNADIIEGVFKAAEDWQSKENVDSNNFTSSLIESSIESTKKNTEHLYSSGGYLDYEQVGQVLYFTGCEGLTVNILYQGVIVDDCGLPSLNFKEVEAIATYCAWVDTQKKGMITKDQATVQLAMMLKQQWQFAVDNARAPEYLNQNDMDNILNVSSSWDRKRYGKSFKPIR